MPELIDLAADLNELTRLAANPEGLDRLLGRALDSLSTIVEYDLAVVFELRGERLRARVARGTLAGDPGVADSVIDLDEFPGLRASLEHGRPVAMRAEDHAREGDPFDGVLDFPNGHACMVVPLMASDRPIGLITFDRACCQIYPPETVVLAHVYGQVLSLAFLFAEQTRRLDGARRALTEQNRLLRAEAQGPTTAIDRIGASRSPAMRGLAQEGRQVALTDAPVLIRGETGVGKEVLAQAIHDWSDRRDRPFVKLNCAALPERLIESELFGHVKGAFSGATADRPGRFVTANGGSLLLDEIGELPPGAQAKLLRVLQEGTFEPVGSDVTVKVDARIIASTHVNLEEAVQAGRFREDLYYRLNVFPMHIPPLRDRLEDLPAIAEACLATLAKRGGRGPWVLSAEAVVHLQGHGWAGNVRELANLLERATILATDGLLAPRHFNLRPLATGNETANEIAPRPEPPQAGRTLDQVQREYITKVLRDTGGRIYGPEGAASVLGLKPSTLQSRMKKLGVERQPGERR